MLPPEVTRFIGKVSATSIFEVEREAIRRFADAIDDPNPLYWDEEYAQKSRYGAIIAPPGFISAPWFAGRSAKWEKRESPSVAAVGEVWPAVVNAGYGRVLDGRIEYEFGPPVQAGDTIKSASVVKDIVERPSQTGKTVFLITETTYTNQKGESVAKVRETTIHPEG